MLQNVSYMFFSKERKQNKATTKKKSLTRKKPKPGQRTQPLLRPIVKLIVFNNFVPRR